MNSDLILVRHARVADCYRGICYGRSDVPLGPEGIEESDRLAEITVRPADPPSHHQRRRAGTGTGRANRRTDGHHDED